MVLEMARPVAVADVADVADVVEAAAAQASARSVRDLAARIAGQVVRAGDAEYTQARQVWNAAFDRYPALVVRAAGAVDVIRTVEYAREHDVPLAVRSGGHSLAGHGVVDGGVVLDVSGMKRMVVDEERRVAWAQPGLMWGEYATRAQQYGLATPAGDAATVGLSGLALGGGIGWLVRKHGLTIDSVLSVELVTADGQLVTASEREHPDLFWALRGGGGNFGVATGFELRMHPVGTVLGGVIVLPAEPEVLEAYGQVAAAAPEALSTILNVMHAPPLPFIPAAQHGKPVCMLLVCYAGDPAEGQAALAPLRAIATPLGEFVAPMPYPALFEMTKEGTVRRPTRMRSSYLRGLDTGAATAIVEQMRAATSPFAIAQLRVLGGAMARVPAEATAFAYRDAAVLFAAINGYQDPADTAREAAWTTNTWQAMQPFAQGVYSNFLGDEGEARVREAYPGATYERLAAVKRQYDPANLFRSNQNIKP